MKANFFDLEALYAPIAVAVEQFAAKTEFKLRKCARGNSGWELVKGREEGGTAHLLLMYDEALGLGIGSAWHFACPELSRSYTHFRPMRPAEIEPSQVIGMLQEERDAILAVRFGYWTHIAELQRSDFESPDVR
jgi:hypothetical protein